MSFQDRSTYDDFLDFDKKSKSRYRGLTLEEAQRVLQLEYALDEQRQSCVDFLLVRASFSADKAEKRAWWILMALLLWVERNHRFPRSEELNAYLTDFLSGPQVPKLPGLFQLDLENLLEVSNNIRMSESLQKRCALDENRQIGDQKNDESE